MHSVMRQSVPLLMFIFLLCCPWMDARAAEPPAVTVLPQEGFNLVVQEQISPSYVIVQLTSPLHNWFAGTFTHLATTDEMTIGISMEGNDSEGNKGDVRKWTGLKPVMTYADPTQYAAYESFTRTPQGVWVSDDPLKAGEARNAGTGIVPRQAVIPSQVAEQFLSADGNYWSPWREVDTVEIVANVNIFRIKQHFALPTATIAMRIPCPCQFQQAFLKQLQACQLPGVTIETVGVSAAHRALPVICLENADPPADGKSRPTVLLIAGEHATEPAGSWAAFGLLKHLLSLPTTAPLRRDVRWMLLPIEDPDGRAASLFDHLTDQFCQTANRYPEVLAYTRYLSDFAFSTNRPIDIVVNLHNVEANEGPNLFSPVADIGQQEDIAVVNRLCYTLLRQQGYLVANTDLPEDIERVFRSRLYGWCASSLASLDIVFEVNDRYPQHRLTLADTQHIGRELGEALLGFCESADGQRRHQQACRTLATRALARACYFQSVCRTPATRTPYDVIGRGF